MKPENRIKKQIYLTIKQRIVKTENIPIQKKKTLKRKEFFSKRVSYKKHEKFIVQYMILHTKQNNKQTEISGS